MTILRLQADGAFPIFTFVSIGRDDEAQESDLHQRMLVLLFGACATIRISPISTTIFSTQVVLKGLEKKVTTTRQ